MILVADMVQSLCPNVVADSAVARRTADGFATVKQQGAGWTWEPHTVGLGPLLSKPTVPYISQRAAYDGLQRAIAALLREGLKVSGVLTRKGPPIHEGVKKLVVRAWEHSRKTECLGASAYRKKAPEPPSRMGREPQPGLAANIVLLTRQQTDPVGIRVDRR